MAVEIQIRNSAFAILFSRAIQAQLYARCLAPIGPVFIDHMDVFESGISIAGGPSGDVRLIVPIDIYLVPEASLPLSENGVPPGATTPAGRLLMEYSLAVAGQSLSVTLADLRPEVPNPQLDPLLQTVRNSAPDLPPLNLAPVFTALGLPAPGSSQILVLADLTVIRFDPAGAAAAHLVAGQDWGLFIDGPGMVGFAQAQVPPLPYGAQVSLAWEPVGGSARLAGNAFANLPDPVAGHAQIPLRVNLDLIGSQPPVLRVTINRSRLQLHTDAPGFIETPVEKAFDKELTKALNPASFGGTRIDDRTFFMDRPLPSVTFGGARLDMTILAADAAGMTLGGPVRPVHASWNTLSSRFTPFGQPSWFGTCRGTGGKGPPKTLKITDVACHASVEFSWAGAYCGTKLLDPGGTAASYIGSDPASPGPADSGSVGFSIPATVARGIRQDVKLILRTARGVRLYNLGHPTVTVDSDGNVEFRTFYIDNCNYLTDDQLSLIEWAKGHGTIDIDILDPPLEDPNWLRLLAGGRGIDVQLVTLSGLEAGELVRFRSADHTIDVTADAAGKALIPIFLPLSEAIGPTSLQRVNRQSMAGKYKIKSAAFMRGPSLERGSINRLDAGKHGEVQLTRRIGDRLMRHAFGGGVAAAALEIDTRTDKVALNPQPIPPAEIPKAFLSAAKKLPGLHQVVLIPGFETEPVAVARMKDGSAVLLQKDGKKSVRVAGSFSGPIGSMTSAGQWSMSVADEQVTLFEVRRT
ncbi:hypothetical protein [Pararhizobium sp.]|uniref:hypothetical protein n=1 Tax=Pararhizobium sp. TaxID=1977563 RepID=UPI002724E560|nr:hypothetical protein [Pararhizobium sp.]MDO9417319.1 hypothetical protein [Pararhizobium sp.]